MAAQRPGGSRAHPRRDRKTEIPAAAAWNRRIAPQSVLPRAGHAAPERAVPSSVGGFARPPDRQSYRSALPSAPAGAPALVAPNSEGGSAQRPAYGPLLFAYIAATSSLASAEILLRMIMHLLSTGVVCRLV